jgi:hypothetical protein
MVERREDIGGKLTWSILVGIISITLGMFFQNTYQKSVMADERSIVNTKDIAVLKEALFNTQVNIEMIRTKQNVHYDLSMKNNADLSAIRFLLEKKQ